MVSFENSVSSYNDDSNLSGREDTNLSSHEEESDIENYLDIRPPSASTKTLTKHELHSTKSSHDRHKKHKRDYDKRRRRKENTKLTDNGERVKYSAGRYYKEQVCMEDFLEHNRCIISNKEEYSGGIQRSEDIYMNKPTKHSSSKHPYENDEDDRRRKRHKRNKYKESENMNCVLQGKKIEFINESKNVNTDDNFENYSGITGNSELAENDTQASRIERLLKAENELETLQKCRQYIKHALKNQEQINEIETLDATALDQPEDQLQANDHTDIKTPSPTSEEAAKGKSVFKDNAFPHIPDHIRIFHISPKHEIVCESQVNDRSTDVKTPIPSSEDAAKGKDNASPRIADHISIFHISPKNEIDCESQGNDISPVSDLPPYYPAIHGCRSVNEFHILNHINEGTYGVVYRAKDKLTREIVALKRLKMEKENEGFPVTSLREINTLMKGQHPNIVTVREIVMGSNMDKIFIVMDYMEHDLKSLIEMMRHKKQSFTAEEVKCLLKQLLCAVAHLHDNWILHRDLKTSNLLLSHNGILKVGDFGLAREYGSPLKAYTPLVVTLWYRAPELILGAKQYSTAIDMWSVGCIFGELVHMIPIFQGKSEVDQLFKVFKILGTPNETIWPGFNKFPAVQHMKITKYPVPNLRSKFHMLTVRGQALLEQLLTYDPTQRISGEDALQHPYFKEFPLPIDPSMFPKWPAKSELDYGRTKGTSHTTTKGYKRSDSKIDEDALGFRINAPAMENRRLPTGGGFSLKF